MHEAAKKPTSSTLEVQQRMTKLAQQNVAQPRRREPTSRVAPKNQVSAAGPSSQTVSRSNVNSSGSRLMPPGHGPDSAAKSSDQQLSHYEMAQGSRLNSNRQSYNLSGVSSQQAPQPGRKNAKLYEHTQQHMGAS